MNKNEGYILIHRRLLEWQHYQEPSVLQVFITLLLLANWKDGWFRGRRVKRGELITTTYSLTNICGLSSNTIDKCLRILVDSKEIEMERNNNLGTFIKILNYQQYNDFRSSKTKELIKEPIEELIGEDIKQIKQRIKNIDVDIKKTPVQNFPKEKMIKSEDLYDWLKFESGQMWQETAMMQLGIHGIDELHILLRRFQSEVIMQGKEEEKESGIKSHFINQTRIYLRNKQKDEQRYNQSNSAKHTDPRELERIAQQMLDHERNQGMAD